MRDHLASTINVDLIKDYLRRYHGIDVFSYKDDFLRRRVRARMIATKCRDFMEYLRLLRTDPHEVKRFLDDMSINVSQFFRDPHIWEKVKTLVFEELIEEKRRTGRRTIKIWSAGCCRGEEPYTISIILHEILGAEINNFFITIIATDIDEDALESAKEGIYPRLSLTSVPLPLLSKYFMPVGNGLYAVKDHVKSLVKFMVHNLLKDPYPLFLDVIVCRNVFIYFSHEAQQRVLERFHRSLNNNGYLILG
ncbi:MAG: protein-glutamate O-methyltransferase CheR, partial [Thermoprotei archaeon]